MVEGYPPRVIWQLMHPRRAVALAALATVSLGGCSASLLPAGSGTTAARSGLPAVHAPGAYRAQAAPRRGGTIVIGTSQLPTTLSPYFGSQAAATPIAEAMYDGLLATGPDLQWYGDMAAGVPTPENGGVKVVGAGMDVTYQLRQGLAWSDGQPITPDDVIFTYQAIAGPGRAAGLNQGGYDLVSGVERSGAGGVVVHFRSLYPAYRSLFPALLPQHRLQGVASDRLAADPYWSRPDVVSGPFVLAEVAPDHITLRRNPHYADGRLEMSFLGHAAYADRVVFRGLPTRQAVLAALKAGEVQADIDLTERELSTVARLADVRVSLAPALAYEQVSLNQTQVNPGTGRTPPWVGDPAVAEALDLALDRPTLERRLLGRPPLTATPVSPLVAWAYDGALAAPAYDLERARRLLDQDGWTPGADGVRVKAGRRLSFFLSTTANQPLRGTEEDVVAAGWRRLGADVRVQDFSGTQLFGGYDQGGVLSHGDYEAALWSWITPEDPDSEFDILHSSAVPASATPSAENYSRCHDPALDQALASGRGTLDVGQRGAAYRAFQQAYVHARCELPLYRRLDIGATSPNLHNFALNPGPAGNTWNLADWWLG
jgi:peptide/nickel transport system substrate-binding protein